MKHEIEIPKRIKVGGFDYKIEFSAGIDRELSANRAMARCSVAWMQYIRIHTNLLPQQTSASFIHEIMHLVDGVYNGDLISEAQIDSISSGLHQVFEQLGIRFVIKKGR